MVAASRDGDDAVMDKDQEPDEQNRPAADGPATDGGSQAAPPPPGQPPYGDYRQAPRLTRRTGDKVIAGVAGGVADYFGIDPLIVRLGFAALALAGGGGILLYVLGWIFIPARGAGEPVRAGTNIDLPKWVGAGLVVLAVLVLMSGLGLFSSGGVFGPELFWALILIGLGLFLLRKEPEPKTVAPPPPPPSDYGPPPAGHPASPGGGPVAYEAAPGAARGSSYPAAPPGYSPPAGTAPMPRERSRLGAITLACVLLVIGGAAVANNFGLTSLDAAQLGALALAVLGAGLVAGAWWGRARWLIVVGLVLLPIVAVVNLVDVPLSGSVGSEYSTPQTQRDIDTNYEVLAGDLTIDFRDYRFADEPADLSLDLAFGEVTVFVPRGVYVEMTGGLEVGQIEFLGGSRAGRGIEIDDRDGDSASEARLSIELDGGVGHVEVIRSGRVIIIDDESTPGGTGSSKKKERP